MKKTLLVALLGLMTMMSALAADTDPVTMTITLKNGTTVTYNASNMDSVRYVGGQFGDNGAIGMKIYLTGQSHSVDYLYSQITNVTYDTTPVVTSDIFTRVTSASQLVAGKRYIIVYESTPVAMGAISSTNTKYGLSVPESGNFAYTDGVVQLTEGTGVKVLTLGGSDGAWTLSMDGALLNHTGTANTLSTGAENNTWTITIDDNGDAVIQNVTDSEYYIMYNKTSGQERFSCYKNTQQPIRLYVEDDGSAASVVATPTFSPGGGTYTSAQTVTISTTTSGATIYYTTNGSTPTTNSTAYTGAITVSANMTIKAIAVKDGVSSTVATASYIISTGGNNNVNANWNIAGSGIPQSKGDPTFTNQSTDDYAWRLEYPHINTASGNQRVVKSVSTYGIVYSIEWDNNKIANRWSCYTMCSKNNASNVDRTNKFYTDGAVTVSPANSYTNSSTYSRGHLCPSADRLATEDQNKLTFYMTNMQPQYSAHNSGLWSTLEGYVRTKWQPTNNTDTLYVVKAATIENVTLNNTTSSGIITTTTDGSGQTLLVPKYFYMAFLYYEKSTGDYKAFALWTEHLNANNPSAATVISNRISIDELERRTGIDFFCNLPDDIEATVEATATYWDNSSNN
ncbi:MAG: DNA/RNA non-specific endonuclease [Muribaculaceae bacterium]|nr:DNA/RNA non-specific endonuclease [Muribaculaceae bacterium]